MVGMFMSIVLWAQVTVFTHVMDHIGLFGTSDSWVELSVQRRLCPIFVSRVRLPDIHEYFAG